MINILLTIYVSRDYLYLAIDHIDIHINIFTDNLCLSIILIFFISYDI